MMKTVSIEKVIFGKDSLPLIAGPCVIESRDHILKMAELILVITSKLGIPLVFKSSFDKANRTSVDSYRGLNIEDGLDILGAVKAEFGIPVLTDIHLPEQAEMAASVVDAIQIPAFLCRQTDLLLAAGRTGKTVNLKKGQFLAPYKMEHAVNKVTSTGNENVLLTERGTFFGYDNLVVDMRSLVIMRERTGFPVVFDATHSAQQPGAAGSKTGGFRKYIPILAKAAVAAGVDGLFMEVHDDPQTAKSDAATQWPLDQLKPLLEILIRIREASKNG